MSNVANIWSFATTTFTCRNSVKCLCVTYAKNDKSVLSVAHTVWRVPIYKLDLKQTGLQAGKIVKQCMINLFGISCQTLPIAKECTFFPPDTVIIHQVGQRANPMGINWENVIWALNCTGKKSKKMTAFFRNFPLTKYGCGSNEGVERGWCERWGKELYILSTLCS